MTLRRFLSTPSARRATSCPRRAFRHRPISIHALREEGDGVGFPGAAGKEISIHALREEGDLGVLCGVLDLNISIHALREEGDPERCPPPALPS